MILRSAPSLPPEFGWIRAGRELSFPVCPDIKERLANHLPDLRVGQTLREALLAKAEAHGVARSIAFLPDGEGDPRLWPNQRIGVKWLRHMRKGILADDPAMGKTVTALASMTKDTGRVLVICASVKQDDWRDHVKRWTDRDPIVLNGSASKRGEVIKNWTQNQILITNFKVMEIERSQLQPDMVIVDEAHKIRNRATRMTKAIKSICRDASDVYLLTANPAINKHADWWALLNICDPDRFGSFWSFAYRFLSVTSNGFGVDVGGVRSDEEGRFEVIIDEYTLRHQKAGAMTMPPVKRRLIQYRMPADHREIYRQMDELGSARWMEETVESEGALSRITRLRQIAVSPRLLFKKYVGSDKLDVLVDLLKESSRGTIVFSSFEKVIEMAHGRLCESGESPVQLTGRMTNNARISSIKAIVDGEAHIILCTHGTGGEGLNFPQLSRVIFLDLAWHPSGNIQAMERVLRPGQVADVVEIIVIRAKDSVEDDIFEIIRMKRPVTLIELDHRRREREQAT